MANYVCIRVIARPVEGAEEDFERLCENLEDSEEFIDSIDGDSSKVWLDIDNFEPVYSDEEAKFQLIAKWNYPRFELEEGLSDNYVVDYDVVFADEYEDRYDIDYSTDDTDALLSEVGCIGVYKKKRMLCEDPDDGYDYVEKYFFPQSVEEKHEMYLYAWAESYYSDEVDYQALYHTNPDDPDDEFFDLREEMSLKSFFSRYEI